jgi:hypothetical protein
MYAHEVLIHEIRDALGVEPDVADEELPETIRTLKSAYTELATAQAGELARKNAALDRIAAAAKDGLRTMGQPPEPK